MSAGEGRIRIEANTLGVTGQSSPPYTFWPVENNQAVIWPEPGSPTIRMRTPGGLPLPLDPEGRFDATGDLMILNSGPVALEIETTNVPLSWSVYVRTVLRSGSDYVVPATFVQGDANSATWSASLQPLPQSDYVAIQARATQP